MPVYEFACKASTCPTYEIWRPIDERAVSTECPVCGGEGKRIFNPIMSLTPTLRLKQERKEPELVKIQTKSNDAPKPRLKESGTRPWMLNRGC